MKCRDGEVFSWLESTDTARSPQATNLAHYLGRIDDIQLLGRAPGNHKIRELYRPSILYLVAVSSRDKADVTRLHPLFHMLNQSTAEPR